MTLRAQLAKSLDASDAELTRRAQALFERQTGSRLPVPLVLCGTGRLGRIAATGLKKTPAGVLAFTDNNPDLQGTEINGIPVLSVEEAVSRYRDRAVFVVTVYTAKPLREQLEKYGIRIASTRALFFQYPEVFLPHASMTMPRGMAAQRDDFMAGLEVWADEASKAEYVAQVEWQLLERDSMPDWTPADQTYFPNELVRLSESEVFVDCGAFDGDSVRSFIARTGGKFKRIVALEPDPSNFMALKTFVAALPVGQRERVRVDQIAVHSARQTLSFVSADGAGSNLASVGDIQVQADRLDDVLHGVHPTFIKVDIEGAEPDAIAGASLTLRNDAPTMAVCLYHAREHLWQIPRQIRAANRAYELYLRRHSDESWETVCYAISPS